MNEGYDITSIDPESGITRRIEVKGIYNWQECPVYASLPQFRHGFSEPPAGLEYWLYVVDGVNSDCPHVFAFRKAMQRVQRFYFDAYTWRGEADEEGHVDLPSATPSGGVPASEQAGTSDGEAGFCPTAQHGDTTGPTSRPAPAQAS
jgi:hypothetical protein